MNFLSTTFVCVDLLQHLNRSQAKVSKIRYVNVYQSEDAGFLFLQTFKRKDHLVSSISRKHWRYVYISWCHPYSVNSWQFLVTFFDMMHYVASILLKHMFITPGTYPRLYIHCIRSWRNFFGLHDVLLCLIS